MRCFWQSSHDFFLRIYICIYYKVMCAALLTPFCPLLTSTVSISKHICIRGVCDYSALELKSFTLPSWVKGDQTSTEGRTTASLCVLQFCHRAKFCKFYRESFFRTFQEPQHRILLLDTIEREFYCRIVFSTYCIWLLLTEVFDGKNSRLTLLSFVIVVLK